MPNSNLVGSTPLSKQHRDDEYERSVCNGRSGQQRPFGADDSAGPEGATYFHLISSGKQGSKRHSASWDGGRDPRAVDVDSRR